MRKNIRNINIKIDTWSNTVVVSGFWMDTFLHFKSVEVELTQLGAILKSLKNKGYETPRVLYTSVDAVWLQYDIN